MQKYWNHLLIIGISAFLYLYSLAPTIVGGDSALFCIRVFQTRLRFGRANNHPLFVVLGKLFSMLPFELAYTLNLLSAFFGVLTVLLIFLSIRHLTHSLCAASFGSLSLMASHAFWLHSVIAEVYTLNAFFVALLLYITLTQMKHRRFIVLFPLVVILGLLNHLIFALVLPAVLLYILIALDAQPRRTILLSLGWLVVLLLALLTGLFLVRAQMMKTWVHAFLIGPPPITHYLYPPAGIRALLQEFVLYVLYFVYQYPIGGIFIGILGVVQLSKKKKAVSALLLLTILFNGLFFIKTTSWGSYGGTKYTFYISDYTVFAIFVGYGSRSLFTVLKHWAKHRSKIHAPQWVSAGVVAASLVATVLFYTTMPSLMTYLNIDLLHARVLPYRDNNTFFLNPGKRGYYGDRKFGEEILKRCKKNAVVFADFTPFTILRYLTVIENKRPDIKLVLCDERMNIAEQIHAIQQETSRIHFYLADNNSYYNLQGLEEQYHIQRDGSFFEMIPRK